MKPFLAIHGHIMGVEKPTFQLMNFLGENFKVRKYIVQYNTCNTIITDYNW